VFTRESAHHGLVAALSSEHRIARDGAQGSVSRIGESLQSNSWRFTPGSEKMSRFFFAVLMASSLFLTAYFGVAAWRLSDEGHLDITGQIRPVAK
jgi:hypothetical protein